MRRLLKANVAMPGPSARGTAKLRAAASIGGFCIARCDPLGETMRSCQDDRGEDGEDGDCSSQRSSNESWETGRPMTKKWRCLRSAEMLENFFARSTAHYRFARLRTMVGTDGEKLAEDKSILSLHYGSSQSEGVPEVFRNRSLWIRLRDPFSESILV